MNTHSENKTFSQDIRNHTSKLSRKTHTRQTKLNSCTEVNLNYSHGFGCWGNERVVFGVRVDSELKKQFTNVSKAVFGSTCNPIESFMAAIVGVYQNSHLNEVNPSITIGEIKIERNLRERRKVETVEREVHETVRAVPKSAVTTSIPRVRLNVSELSLEQLQRLYDVSKPGGRRVVLAAELKRRGVVQ